VRKLALSEAEEDDDEGGHWTPPPHFNWPQGFQTLPFKLEKQKRESKAYQDALKLKDILLFT
jgi:hypothetical protein